MIEYIYPQKNLLNHFKQILLFSIIPSIIWCSPSNEKSLIIPYTESEITIDGYPDESIWETALTIKDFNIKGSSQKDTDKTIIKLLYDDSFLYIGYECYDSFSGDFVATEIGHGSLIKENDNIQIFIQPDADQYYHYFVNPMGVMRDDQVKIKYKRTVAGWHIPAYTPTDFHPDYWTGEIALPLEYLLDYSNYSRSQKRGKTGDYHYKITQKKSIKLNFVRLKNKGREKREKLFWIKKKHFLNDSSFSFYFEKEIIVNPNAGSLPPFFEQAFEVTKTMRQHRPEHWEKIKDDKLKFRLRGGKDDFVREVNLYHEEFGWYSEWNDFILKRALRLSSNRNQFDDLDHLQEWQTLLKSMDAKVETSKEKFDLALAKINIARLSGETNFEPHLSTIPEIRKKDPYRLFNFVDQYYHAETKRRRNGSFDAEIGPILSQQFLKELGEIKDTTSHLLLTHFADSLLAWCSMGSGMKKTEENKPSKKILRTITRSAARLNDYVNKSNRYNKNSHLIGKKDYFALNKLCSQILSDSTLSHIHFEIKKLFFEYPRIWNLNYSDLNTDQKKDIQTELFYSLLNEFDSTKHENFSPQKISIIIIGFYKENPKDPRLKLIFDKVGNYWEKSLSDFSSTLFLGDHLLMTGSPNLAKSFFQKIVEKKKNNFPIQSNKYFLRMIENEMTQEKYDWKKFKSLMQIRHNRLNSFNNTECRVVNPTSKTDTVSLNLHWNEKEAEIISNLFRYDITELPSFQLNRFNDGTEHIKLLFTDSLGGQKYFHLAKNSIKDPRLKIDVEKLKTVLEDNILTNSHVPGKVKEKILDYREKISLSDDWGFQIETADSLLTLIAEKWNNENFIKNEISILKTFLPEEKHETLDAYYLKFLVYDYFELTQHRFAPNKEKQVKILEELIDFKNIYPKSNYNEIADAYSMLTIQDSPLVNTLFTKLTNGDSPLLKEIGPIITLLYLRRGDFEKMDKILQLMKDANFQKEQLHTLLTLVKTATMSRSSKFLPAQKFSIAKRFLNEYKHWEKTGHSQEEIMLFPFRFAYQINGKFDWIDRRLINIHEDAPEQWEHYLNVRKTFPDFDEESILQLIQNKKMLGPKKPRRKKELRKSKN